MSDEEINKIELQELAENNSVEDESNDTTLVKRDVSLVGHVKVNVQVNVGHAEMSVDELFRLKEGNQVTLEEGVNEPVTLLVDGKPVARGHLVAVGDKFGVQVTELSDE